MSQIEERPDGSRWMLVQVADRTEWRELQTRTVSYHYLDSDVDHSVSVEEPMLHEGELMAKAYDGRFVIVSQESPLPLQDRLRALAASWCAGSTGATSDKESLASETAREVCAEQLEAVLAEFHRTT